MSDVFTIIGMPRERLLDEARQFSEQVKVFDLTEVVEVMQATAPGRAGITYPQSDAEAVTSALRLAPKLATALMAMALLNGQLKEDLAKLTAESKRRPAVAPSVGGSGFDENPLIDDLARLRAVIENLILNAEFAWEQGAEARDWKKAIAEAREILNSLHPK